MRKVKLEIENRYTGENIILLGGLITLWPGIGLGERLEGECFDEPYLYHVQLVNKCKDMCIQRILFFIYI